MAGRSRFPSARPARHPGRYLRGTPLPRHSNTPSGTRQAARPAGGTGEERERAGLPVALERCKALVGHAPLRDIVREAIDAIERQCIVTALELAHDNRALAAGILGLSRQSLYVKLRRYGVGKPGAGARP